MKITVPSFAGMRPRIGAKYLGETEATLARDCRLYSGELRPLRAHTLVTTLAKPGATQSVYLFAGQFWFHWAGDVDVARSMVPGDTNERTYYTGDGVPKVTQAGMATAGGTNYPMQSYNLGIPKPTQAPTVSVPAFDEETENETRFYVYTYVSGWGEEGPPSDPSSVVTCDVDATASLSGMSGNISGPYQITHKRIYRLSTGVDDSEFFFVAEIPVSPSFYTDSVPGSQLQEPLATEGWDPPPADLKGLIALPNGVFCGFAGKDLYFTPPYGPYAWPRRYMVSSEYPIVGIAAFGTNVVVATEGHPYLAAGIDPSAVSLSKLELPQACVAKRSIAALGTEGVVYASPDGLVGIGPAGIDMISSAFMTQEEWRTYNPESMVAAVHDNRYIVFYERADNSKGGLIFDSESGFTELLVHATGVHADLRTDRLYLAQNNQQLLEYDAGNPLSYTWRSKIFQTPPLSFAAARVLMADSTPATVKITGDGVTVFDGAVSSANAFRLASGLRFREWQVEITGSGHVQELSIVGSAHELGGV